MIRFTWSPENHYSYEHFNVHLHCAHRIDLSQPNIAGWNIYFLPHTLKLPILFICTLASIDSILTFIEQWPEQSYVLSSSKLLCFNGSMSFDLNISFLFCWTPSKEWTISKIFSTLWSRFIGQECVAMVVASKYDVTDCWWPTPVVSRWPTSRWSTWWWWVCTPVNGLNWSWATTLKCGDTRPCFRSPSCALSLRTWT